MKAAVREKYDFSDTMTENMGLNRFDKALEILKAHPFLVVDLSKEIRRLLSDTISKIQPF
jgi:hypothetical protein